MVGRDARANPCQAQRVLRPLAGGGGIGCGCDECSLLVSRQLCRHLPGSIGHRLDGTGWQAFHEEWLRGVGTALIVIVGVGYGFAKTSMVCESNQQTVLVLHTESDFRGNTERALQIHTGLARIVFRCAWARRAVVRCLLATRCGVPQCAESEPFCPGREIAMIECLCLHP
jgi:hypothetical protein